MKKNLRWIFIRLICFAGFFALFNNSYSQLLYGMTSDGGGKKLGGNIFSINGDGTSYTERFKFFNDGEPSYGGHLLDYGDGYLYGVTNQFIYRHLFDGSSYEVVYVFQEQTGTIPNGGIIKGNDGFLYGVTSQGGNYDDGVIYKVKKNGTSYQVLRHFNSTDGTDPYGKLLQLGTDVIFGTTRYGSGSSKGHVYRINPDGSGYQVIHSFQGQDGAEPFGALTAININSKTYLYGITYKGGTYDNGVIYRLEPNGSNFSTRFSFGNGSGIHPTGYLIRIGTSLYGATLRGGNHSGGVVFAYDAVMDSYQKLHEFYEDEDGFFESGPLGGLINISNVLYGTTQEGGSSTNGVLYKLNIDGTGYQVIHELDEVNMFNYGGGNLVLVNNQIYGLTPGYPGYYCNYGKIFKTNPDGSSFQTIRRFQDENGFGPSGSLIRGQDGKLYGLTPEGGSIYSNGVAFSIQTDGTNYTPLVLFGGGMSDGHTRGSLIQASNGSFYGLKTSGSGGQNGQVFMLSTNGQFSTLLGYNFPCQGAACLAYPVASLLQASDGNLYGMTLGISRNGDGIFKINPDGTGYTVLKEFNGLDGDVPGGSLIQAPDGYLYGMTEYGGSNDYGTIFKIRTNGTGFQTLFQFGTYASAYYGARPKGSLLLGSDGKLYGMASGGGTFGGGTLFQINTDGSGMTRLLDFNSVNGWYPIASLIEHSSSGFLFGMTQQGGTSNFGVVFKIKKDGTSYQTILNFNGTNGKYPRGDLLIVPPNPPIPLPTARPNSVTIEKNANSSISIFPNPVRQSFTIRFPKQLSGRVVYSLKDLSGRKLMEKTIDRSAFTEIKSVDISSLPTGTYLLELSTPHQKFTQKIVKQ